MVERQISPSRFGRTSNIISVAVAASSSSPPPQQLRRVRFDISHGSSRCSSSSFSRIATLGDTQYLPSVQIDAQNPHLFLANDEQLMKEHLVQAISKDLSPLSRDFLIAKCQVESSKLRNQFVIEKAKQPLIQRLTAAEERLLNPNNSGDFFQKYPNSSGRSPVPLPPTMQINVKHFALNSLRNRLGTPERGRRLPSPENLSEQRSHESSFTQQSRLSPVLKVVPMFIELQRELTLQQKHSEHDKQTRLVSWKYDHPAQQGLLRTACSAKSLEKLASFAATKHRSEEILKRKMKKPRQQQTNKGLTPSLIHAEFQQIIDNHNNEQAKSRERFLNRIEVQPVNQFRKKVWATHDVDSHIRSTFASASREIARDASFLKISPR